MSLRRLPRLGSRGHYRPMSLAHLESLPVRAFADRCLCRIDCGLVIHSHEQCLVAAILTLLQRITEQKRDNRLHV